MAFCVIQYKKMQKKAGLPTAVSATPFKNQNSSAFHDRLIKLSVEDLFFSNYRRISVLAAQGPTFL